jgi:hypothetical protein
MAVLIVALVVIGLIAMVIGGVFLVGTQYDRHPLVKKVLDSFAAMTPGYYNPPDPRDSLPREYVDDAPGWDKLDA